MARYEVWTSDGKTFIPWFAHITIPMSESEANAIIKQTKKDFGFIDQKTKLKHEYMIKSYDEYIHEQNEMKEKLVEAQKKHDEYLKSPEYKELQKKKRQAAKERKERQKKYAEEHGII